MKKFFTKKRIAYLAMICVSLLALIILLFVPIGSLGYSCLVYSTKFYYFIIAESSEQIIKILQSPFTFGSATILFWQTIAFTLIGIIFIVFLILFVIELKRAGLFKHIHSSTKTDRLQAQIDELQKQVDELKNNEK